MQATFWIVALGRFDYISKKQPHSYQMTVPGKNSLLMCSETLTRPRDFSGFQPLS